MDYKKAIVMISVGILCFGACAAPEDVREQLTPGFSECLRDSHDLRLPDWGPYTKNYAGISHIPVLQEGARFDVSVMPGLDAETITLPDVRKRAAYHPWEFSSDLSYFSYRYDLEWKDQVFADVSFAKVNDFSRLIRAEFVNRTADDHDSVLHYMLNMNPPKKRSMQRVKLPEHALWVNGVPYHQLHLIGRKSSCRDSLMPDGKLRGDTTDVNMVLGRGLAFGKKDGEKVRYVVDLPASIDADLIVRYKSKAEAQLRFSGMVTGTCELNATESFSTATLPAGMLNKGRGELSIEVRGGEVMLDGFAVVPKDTQADLQFNKVSWSTAPNVQKGPVPQSYIIQYPGCDLFYGFAVSHPAAELKVINGSNLEEALKKPDTFKGNKKACYLDVALPVDLKSNSEQVLDALVCYGDRKHVEADLTAFNQSDPSIKEAYRVARAGRIDMKGNASGETYRFSQERMAATLLGNSCYPIYTQGRYIRHYQPGKKWLSLYTWDAGFAGIGLINVDLNRSLDILNTYTTNPGSESAFIHHGTPLPVQIYQFIELWNATQSDELLSYFYPRLKQYYEFLLGRYGSSNTRSEKTHGLIRTWNYFYNSGGWDDYPPQVKVHKDKMTAYTVPVISSAHEIRAAKLLKMAALKLGKTGDVKMYDEDIRTLSTALQHYSWDKESGYFGYVVVKDGATSILRTEDGINYNEGLGGVSPLVSGIGTPEQIDAMMAHVKSPEQLWSKVGLSTVDQSAPYYQSDGYWNGSVWMPHQWFMWKAMFDIGEAEMAYKISTTALRVWKESVEEGYNCQELFNIESGKGSGWHQFGALSGPVTHWFSALYTPGTVTVGYDTWIDKKTVSPDQIDLGLICYEPSKNNMVWICMKEAESYHVELNGVQCPYKLLHPGLLQLQIKNVTNCAVSVQTAK